MRVDCLSIFNSRNALFFRSTASRPNLKYSVRAKSDKKERVVEDMAQYIKENHRGEAGIVYTFSKREANETADSLCAKGERVRCAVWLSVAFWPNQVYIICVFF